MHSVLREFTLLLRCHNLKLHCNGYSEYTAMSDDDDFEEIPRTRPTSSRNQIPRNMSMNSLAKYLANSAEIEGLRSALKSG